jgi:hypothetical protein
MRRCLTKVALACLVMAATTIPLHGQPKGSSSSGTGSGKQSGPTNPDSVHDIVLAPFTSSLELLSSSTKPTDSDVLQDIGKIQNLAELPWPTANGQKGLQPLVKKYLDAQPAYSACGMVDTHQVYIFHINHWVPSGNSEFRIVSSSWYAYKFTKKGTLKFSGFTGTGDQFIYGKTRALVIGISGFDSVQNADLTHFKDSYTVSVIQGTPENAQDLGQLIAALGGFAGVQPQGAGVAASQTPMFVSVGCQPGSAKLPFTLTVTDSTTAKDPPSDSGSNKAADNSSQSGTVTCSTAGSSTPCVSTHSFVSKDRELWDVSVGVTTPGTRETKFSFSNGAVQTSVTRHTDLYGMFDFFPAGMRYSKESAFPHINVGLPMTSQSFYRPYFGLAENLTGWTHMQKKFALPVAINFFAGAVFLKTNYLVGNPTTQAEFNSSLKSTRVWKGLFGIEIPISSIASKIGGKGGSSKAGSGKSGSGSGN